MSNSTCFESYERHVEPLDMLTVWQAVSGICKDPLNLCTYNNGLYSFEKDIDIPANYICIGYEHFYKDFDDITSIGRS